MKSSKDLTQIKELDIAHLFDLSLMVNYSELYDDEKILVEKDEQEYELQDSYCKNPDCDCTEVHFGVFLKEEKIGGIRYNYQEGKITEPSDFAYLMEEFREMGEENFKLFNKLLSLHHEVVKNVFELFKLEKENEGYQEEIEPYKKQIKTIQNSTPKIGRNESCPCGSGKKYKKCCLKSASR